MKSRNINLQETIDSMALHDGELRKVFSDLDSINRITQNYALFQRAMKPVISALKKTDRSSVRIIDLGCGTGEQLNKIREMFEHSCLSCHCTGLDLNPKLIADAREKYKSHVNMDFGIADILDEKFQLPECDVVTSSQFLYRFSDEAFLNFLKNNFEQVAMALVISELNRNRLAGIFFPPIAALLNWHATTISDGLVALKKCWTRKELMKLLTSSRMFHKIESRTVPFRFAMTCFRQP